MGTKLYVGNLNYNTNEDSLRVAFSANGREVASVSVVMDRETGRSRGFAFVEMTTAEGAQQAMAELEGQELDGRLLRINEAREREPRGRSFGGPRPGGGYGGGGGGYGGGAGGGAGGGYGGGGGGYGGGPGPGGGSPGGGPGGPSGPRPNNFGPNRPAGGGGFRSGSPGGKKRGGDRDREGGGGEKKRRGKPDGSDGW